MANKKTSHARSAQEATGRVAVTPAPVSPVPATDVAASLEYLKRRITAVKAHLEAEAASLGAGPLVGNDFDGLVAAAQLTAQQETDDLLRDLLAQRLGALERASQRARQGSYGICESCGVAIPPERLEAVPHTALCVACQSRRERPRLRRAA